MDEKQNFSEGDDDYDDERIKFLCLLIALLHSINIVAYDTNEM